MVRLFEGTFSVRFLDTSTSCFVHWRQVFGRCLKSGWFGIRMKTTCLNIELVQISDTRCTHIFQSKYDYFSFYSINKVNSFIFIDSRFDSTEHPGCQHDTGFGCSQQCRRTSSGCHRSTTVTWIWT